jgi:hypothetical protein
VIANRYMRSEGDIGIVLMQNEVTHNAIVRLARIAFNARKLVIFKVRCLIFHPGFCCVRVSPIGMYGVRSSFLNRILDLRLLLDPKPVRLKREHACGQ